MGVPPVPEDRTATGHPPTPGRLVKSIRVPFTDLGLQHQRLRPALDAAFDEVITSGAFAGGPFVARFEEEFSAFCNSRFAVGVGSGTEALWLSLLALGVGPGDEVVTVPNTFMATAEAISCCGAHPVFVDVDPVTHTLDPERLGDALTSRTKAILPVHLYGHPAHLDPILELAAHHGIPVVEDACQAHGALYRGRQVGTLGTVGCFSFYPGKNLGALGEAGAIVTEEPAIYEKLLRLRDHGQSRKYHHGIVGWNARMDGLQAAVLRVKLPHLHAWNGLRRSHAARYRSGLSDHPDIRVPSEASYALSVHHLYCVRVPNRDQVLNDMADAGITCGIHYPVPIHLQEAYRHLDLGPGSFPVTERSANELLSLPIFPELTPDQLDLVVDSLRHAVSGRATPKRSLVMA